MKFMQNILEKKYDKVLEIMERDCFFSPQEAVRFWT